MSVRVNLLPSEALERQRASRQRALAGLAALLLLVLLAGVYWWQNSRIQDARSELATEEERVSELQAEVDGLREFDELRARLTDAEETLAAVLANEVTLAGILQDLAAVTPPDAQIDDLTASIGATDEERLGAEGPSVGAFTINGQTVTSHAPGVERLLLSLGKVASFQELFVESSILEELEGVDEPVVSYTVDGRIGSEVLTGRYLDGLPEDLR